MQSVPDDVLKNSEALRPYYDTLNRYQLTEATAILKLTNAGLRMVTGLTTEQSDAVLQAVSEVVLGEGQVLAPISTIAEKCEFISTGCNIMDRFLGGGIPVRGITEISGESSSGKTQICLQLSLMAQITAESTAYVVYICTEDRFPDKRFRRMLHERGETGTDLSDNILVSHIGELDVLMTRLEHTLPSLQRSKNVRLLVIDSVAALFRSEYGEGQGIQRAADLMKFACALDKVWRTGVAVLCVNQVTDAVSDTVMLPVQGATAVPSLGLSWANAVTTRIFLSRTSTVCWESPNAAEPPAVVRRMYVPFAPHLPRSSCCLYIINARGVCGIEHDDARMTPSVEAPKE